MDSFPNNIILKILGFLPGKESQRLRCVCKRFQVLVNENPTHMRKMKATMNISDGFGKGFAMEKHPFELRLEVGEKEFKIYADNSAQFSGDYAFCMKFTRSLQPVKNRWCYVNETLADLTEDDGNYDDDEEDDEQDDFDFERNFVYRVNPRIVHSKDFPIVKLFERIVDVMEITQLTVEHALYPLMQHVFGQLAKTRKFRLHKLIIPIKHECKEDECESDEICRVLDWELNKNSELLVFDPLFKYEADLIILTKEGIKTMNLLGKKYENVFWMTDLPNIYQALKNILKEWLLDELKDLCFSFLILQGRKLNRRSRNILDEFDREDRQDLHRQFVKDVIELGVSSNYFGSDYDEWLNIDDLPEDALEFYIDGRRTVRLFFVKKDEDTAIGKLSMLN